jgi:hypothetical protein
MTIANPTDPSTKTGTPGGAATERLDKIDAIYFDNATDAGVGRGQVRPVRRARVSLVPLAQAGWDGDALTVRVDKQALKPAPHHNADATLSAEDEVELYPPSRRLHRPVHHRGRRAGHRSAP